MQNIDLINESITNASAMLGAHPVDCKNGVVTLSGYFANKNDKNKALRKAIANPGVSKVINNAN